MLRGKYLQFAIRLILTQWCHLPQVVQQRSGLLVYLGRQAGGHLLSEHHLVVLGDPRGNLTALATSRPPHLHLSCHPLSTPHGCVHPLPNMENHTQIRHNPAASIQDGNPWPIRVFLVGKASRHPAGRLGSGPPSALNSQSEPIFADVSRWWRLASGSHDGPRGSR